MTEQPYFMVKVTRCGECLHYYRRPRVGVICLLAAKGKGLTTHEENRISITPSCPMWSQRVQQEKQG